MCVEEAMEACLDGGRAASLLAAVSRAFAVGSFFAVLPLFFFSLAYSQAMWSSIWPWPSWLASMKSVRGEGEHGHVPLQWAQGA